MKRRLMHLVVVVDDDDDDAYYFSSDNLRIMFILVTSSFRTSSVSGQEGEGEVDRGRCQGENHTVKEMKHIEKVLHERNLS